MTITKALRKLYKVIVGEEAPANANTITKVLLALAEAWTGGGSGGSGGGDLGYSCKQEITTVVNAAVTTVEPTDPDPISPYPFGDISYNKLLDSETINVNFNGVDYTCEQMKIDDNDYYYGATGDDSDFDWSEYPFRILTSKNPIDESEGNILYTENAGVYDLKIDKVEISVDVTPCFAAAVKKVTSIV